MYNMASHVEALRAGHAFLPTGEGMRDEQVAQAVKIEQKAF